MDPVALTSHDSTSLHTMHPNEPTIKPGDVDIVIPTIRDLSFLEHWRHYFSPYHIIVIKDGDPSRTLSIPSGFDITLYNRNDIDRALGNDAWCISKGDSACRCFGWLMSKKRYVYTIDDDCFPAHHPNGTVINPIAQHLTNLQTSSTPYYFNTLYDPYRHGSEFVRGYPFGLRSGVPTVISHGLWMNIPDYDALTQLVKPNDRQQRYVDAVVTVPKGTLFSMSGMNLAFDRQRIGMAMYFGLMGDGYPIGRYDDLWAGWVTKTVCDHLGLGIKSGLPYVWHSKASNPFTNLKKEFNGIFWQEKLIPFFQDFSFTSSAINLDTCLRELIEGIRTDLGRVDAYFARLADGMETWMNVWMQLH